MLHFAPGRSEPADANLSKPRRTHFANVEFGMPGHMLTRLVDSQKFWTQSEPLNSEKHVGALRCFTEVLASERAT